LKLKLLMIFSVLVLAVSVSAQTGVTAEAIQQANVRAATDVNADMLGQITAGTRYPVVGRSQFYPWLLLGNPATGQALGWVFQDLVTVQGDINTLPFTEVTLSGAAVLPTVPAATLAPNLPTPTLSTAIVATTPPPAASVTGAVLNEINIRYGPGTEYDRVGVGRAGDIFEIVAWHTQLPWLQIRYAASPTGLAWVATDLLEIQGDVDTLPSISQITFALPTLTPTPSAVDSAQFGEVPLSPEFRALGAELWDQMVAAEFDPLTSRLGAFFVKDLQTGEAFVIGDETAFSGMSVNKIAILTTYYSQITLPPDDASANMLAEAMICSENISTNEILSAVGSGNPYTGAETVSAFMDQIGFADSFIYTPYANDPFITPQAPRTERTTADQIAADPDPYNQVTVSEIGTLLDGLYQCSTEGAGLLIDSFGSAFTQIECAQILNLMSYNRIGSFIEMGVPESVRVAHKHGWIEDTHGDAAVVYSPGGDYVFVVVLHNPIYLEFFETAPLIENMSLTIYNYFNPDQPMTEIRTEGGSETCVLLGNPVIDQLTSGSMP